MFAINRSLVFGLLSTATASSLPRPAAASRALHLRGGATLPEAVLTATGSAATISLTHT